MRHMNNHYKPINLQLFADNNSDSTENGSENNNTGEEGINGESNPASPTVEELMTQLSEARAESAKLKLANTKASKEAAEYKRQLQAKMTAEEQEAEAKAEAEQAKDARIQELETQFRIMAYTKRYMGIGADEKTAESLSELTGEISDADKFFSALDKFIKVKIKNASEEAIQKYIKERPDFQAGSGEQKNSLAVEKAKELAKDRNYGSVNQEALKKFM